MGAKKIYDQIKFLNKEGYGKYGKGVRNLPGR